MSILPGMHRSAARLGAIVLFLTFVSRPAFSEPGKPNILILVADDMGYADAGFNGGNVAAMPNLDHLAGTGVRLTDFRASPICSPTRAGLMTGRWPLRFGMMRAVVPPWSRHGLPPDETTMPEWLAEAGYDRRALVGKWHLGHAKPDHLPLRQGFTRFKGHYNGAIDYFTHEREGEVDWHDDEQTVREEGYSTDLISEAAAEFIRESPVDSPWFLYVAFNAPHGPFQAKPEDLAKYARIENERHRTYAAMVDCMDRGIGRILAEVERRPDARNTLVLFFSDNGGERSSGSSNQPFRGGKFTVHEGGTRVCAAIRWPQGGLDGGRDFDGRVGYIDIVPTVLAASGLSAPPELDGIDIVPAIREGSEIPERPWFSYIDQDGQAAASVHLGHWKLVALGDFFAKRPEREPKFELYDLSSDPGENEDVALRHPEVVSDLVAKLREFGRLQKPGVGAYAEGRKGFQAPDDWIVK